MDFFIQMFNSLKWMIIIRKNVLDILLQIRLALSPHLVWGSVIQGLKAFWLIKKSSGYFCRKNVSAFSNSHSALFVTESRPGFRISFGDEGFSRIVTLCSDKHEMLMCLVYFNNYTLGIVPFPLLLFHKKHLGKCLRKTWMNGWKTQANLNTFLYCRTFQNHYFLNLIFI